MPRNSEPRNTAEHDFFVSYARVDNQQGFVKRYVDAIVEEHAKFSGGRKLSYFFDTERIPNLSSWETEIFQKHLVRLAVPNPTGTLP